MNVLFAVLLFHVVATVSATEAVLFESGRKFKVVDPTSVDAAEFKDPKNTGSWLFDASVDDNDKKRLSLVVDVRRFRSNTSKFFRAHPVFIACLQGVMNAMQNDDTPVMLRSGYKTRSDTGDSNTPQDIYARAGTAAVIAFKPGIVADIKNIASAALKHCPPIFERIQRDIGVIMMAGAVHIHMTGSDDNEPLFRSDGFSEMSTQRFQFWALSAIDSGIGPIQSPRCDKYSGLGVGDTHPAGVTSAAQVVGEVDEPILWDTQEDLKTLVQYQGGNVAFAKPVGSSNRCGEDGQPASNALLKRCDTRLMSSRMYNKFAVLQKLVREHIPGSSLKVLKAFDQPHEGNTEYNPAALHAEGRQLVLQLSTVNTEANLKTVTKLARCTGMDYIKHNGNEVIVAVRKMVVDSPQKVNFQGTELIAVAPPYDKQINYKLPDQFEPAEIAQYPLFDSSGQMETLLAANSQLKLFISKDPEFRYLRLHPLIPRCYSLMLHQHNKHMAATDQETTLNVIRGFVSTREQNLTIDAFDQRFNTFILGLALEVNYGENPNNFSLEHLARTAVDKCGPLFAEAEMKLGVGVYLDRVFVDMREEMEVWGDTRILTLALKEQLFTRFQAALANRIVDPDDLAKAMKSAWMPSLQSVDYRHSTPQHIASRKAVEGEDKCVSKDDTAFCKRSKKHRDELIQNIQKEVSRKYYYHDKEETLKALENCFGMCSTCMEDLNYEKKLENCDNFLHWVNFGLLNEATSSNLFPREDHELRQYARQGHTVEDSALFHLVVNAAEAVFRPDPAMGVEEYVYPMTENPNPVMKVLYRLYAIHASGVAKVWVKDDTDISALRDPLQVLMLYNKNITEVEVYVASIGSMDAVDSAIQSLILEWSTTGYPEYTREVIAPFTLHTLPKLVRRRDTDTYIAEEMIREHFGRTDRWMHREL